MGICMTAGHQTPRDNDRHVQGPSLFGPQPRSWDCGLAFSHPMTVMTPYVCGVGSVGVHTATKACRKLRVLSMGVSASIWLLGMNLSCMTASKRCAKSKASCWKASFSFLMAAVCISIWILFCSRSWFSLYPPQVDLYLLCIPVQLYPLPSKIPSLQIVQPACADDHTGSKYGRSWGV